MKDDICLDCILKSQNTRSVPLWQKKEGQDSLLPKIIRNDLYNPRKTELKREYPKLTTNKTKLKLEMMDDGERLEVWLDAGDPIKNVPMSLRNDGHKVLAEDPLGADEQHFKVLVEKVET